METIERKNPTDLLVEQLENLKELVKIQQEQLQIARIQNENMVRTLNIVNEFKDANRYFNIKIQDVNIPFMALIGLLIKVTLASIPAALIIGLLSFLFFIVFGGFLTTLVALIGN